MWYGAVLVFLAISALNSPGISVNLYIHIIHFEVLTPKNQLGPTQHGICISFIHTSLPLFAMSAIIPIPPTFIHTLLTNTLNFSMWPVDISPTRVHSCDRSDVCRLSHPWFHLRISPGQGLSRRTSCQATHRKLLGKLLYLWLYIKIRIDKLNTCKCELYVDVGPCC